MLSKLAIRLLVNGLRFQYQKRTGRPGRPQAISLEITHRCIAKCLMCNIWKIPWEVADLPMEKWVRLLASHLFSDLKELDITGGEPFMRTDLPDLFEGICALKQGNLKSLQSVAVTTNALLTSRVVGYTEAILKMLEKTGIDLVVVCALDGVGETHERIRNVKDAWSKVNQSVEGLTGLREKYPHLIIGLKTTILPINISELGGIVRYADSKGLFTIISPCIITKGRYLNPELAEALAFSPKDIRAMIRFYESRPSRWRFHDERLVRYFRTGRMRKPCTCGFNYLFVRSTGEVYLCPLISEGVGNIKDAPIDVLFTSRKASRIRRGIGRFPECRGCTEPGLERYALPYEGFAYLFLLLKMGRQAFLRLHQHMGLDKYLT